MRSSIAATDPEDIALLHFTSGTTGMPKGAIHVHDAVVAHYATGKYRPRSSSRRRLLVHRRSRLGDRHLLRDHRAARARHHQHRRRGRVRRRALVPHDPGAARHRLVHRADRDPDVDAGRGGSGATLRPEQPALCGQRRRATQPGGCRLGPGGVRFADSRQLVADGDGRDHDRQLRRDGHPPRLDGSSPARHQRRHRPGQRGDAGGPGGRPSRTSRANWHCGRAGRRCSAATCTTRSATANASPVAGI